MVNKDIVKKYLAMAQDGFENGPKNETLAEHREHCKAEPGNCPFEKKLVFEEKQTEGITGNEHPNEKSTEQLDAEYADAVKRGDKETALRMIREAAAKAMPNTKVVDKDGLPLVCYHDSGELHNVLSRDYARKSMDIEAVFFHLKRDKYHEYGNVEHRVFLNIEHPANFKQAHEGFEYGVTDDAGVKQREKLQREGYDGAIFTSEEMGGDDLAEAFVFDSNQIKSADITYDDAGNLIPLSKRFNFKSNDIRY